MQIRISDDHIPLEHLSGQDHILLSNRIDAFFEALICFHCIVPLRFSSAKVGMNMRRSSRFADYQLRNIAEKTFCIVLQVRI